MALSWGATADVRRYDAAVDWFRARAVITAAEARELDDRAKTEAFWVGNGLQLSQILRVFDEAADAIEKGEPFEDWRKRVRGELRNDSHAETVFRNAAQRAYNAGRWHEMRQPAALQHRPYWLFDAVLDSRTSFICLERGEPPTILLADDPWWLANWPPLHHRCRSAVRSIRRSEAERRGITTDLTDTPPDSGFGAAPGQAAPWRPDPNKHDPALSTELERKASKAGGKTRRKKVPERHTAAFWEPSYRERYGDAAPALAHGKAALERGLDLPASKALERLGELDVDGAVRMRAAIEDLAGGRDLDQSLRELGAEIEPLAHAAAAVAGHLDSLPRRPSQLGRRKNPDLQRATRFFARMCHPDLAQPTSWTFRAVRSRASCDHIAQVIRYRSVPGVLEHEWGHALEALNQRAAAHAVAFLQARTNGESTTGLATLFPGHGYSSLERAWRDDFLHAYVGKRYQLPSGAFFATEITSMAVELISAGERSFGTLAELAAKDPEHLLLVLGVLAGA